MPKNYKNHFLGISPPTVGLGIWSVTTLFTLVYIFMKIKEICSSICNESLYERKIRYFILSVDKVLYSILENT